MSAPYAAYLGSDIDGMLVLPKHWRTVPLKAVCTHNDEVLDENTPKNYEIDYVDISGVDSINGVVRKETMLFGAAPSRARRRVRHGDVIVSTVRTYLRAIAKVRDPEPNLIVSTGFAVIRPKEGVTPDFLGYMLASNHFVDQVIARSVGVSYPAINASELVRIPVPVPPPSEQLAIARFLDRETSKIDALVDEQHRLIELLNEKRQAITSRAVTKGLSPNAPMKPSGIEWLGDVPAHWDVLPFRRVTTRVDVGVAEAATHAYVDQGIPMVRSTNIKFQFVDTSDLLFLDKTFADRLRSKRIRSGDILTTRTGANLGVSAVVPPSLDSAQCFTLLVSTVATDCDPNFYNLFINGDPGRVHFARTAWGASQPNIDVPTLKEMPCVRPPLPEQQAIVRFVQDRTMHLDDLKNDACRAIQLLGERRVTVVSAAVTGQIGVRSATELEPA